MMSSLFSMAGKKALVTGSSGGIGRALAMAFAEAGADTIILHGSRPDGERLCAEFAAAGARAHYVAGDLTGVGAGRAVAEEVMKKTGGVDIVVLNAAVQIRRPWLEITPEEFDKQIRANLQASLEILQILVPAMQEKRWGRILTIGSVQQRKPHPQMAVYAAMKAAQMNLAGNLSRQLAGDGITVNNLSPGVILTGRNAGALADEQYASAVLSTIPVGFFGEVQDCLGAAILLCTEAGRYITGIDLPVDGGFGLP